MPFLGLGLHIFVAIFFAIHAIRSGRELYWLLILFMFPLFGSVVYFFAIFLPSLKSNTHVQLGLRKVTTAAVNSIDPGRELRDAKAAYEFTPTAQNQWRYADALLAADQVADAVQQFEICLQGPFAKDLEIQFAAANAQLRFQQPEKALNLLLAIRESSITFRTEAVTLLLAKIYAMQGNKVAAKQEFEQVVTQFGSVEARAEYAIWAAQNGDMNTAQHLRAELNDLKKHWNKNSRAQYQPLLVKLESVLQGQQ
ncbi:hypothetical protein [Solimicrobium silvestre]|uniref:Uncharacterized protein conserved in bacteria containing a divergent form of TPR repeat n=1 Tax=Solimicrobium silvestre TaxID=2099400 RepID=A0A2S9GV30_9BURK|nr:hypothetical protein [Solimicrobium silvestre]PRC91516.1 Uncharacterized protein conserved in bacteria containing a divergent form of TPR repeat [Solimicrobium silvestre]